MSLIDAEQDDEAVLRAEDEAIRAAENPAEPEHAVPVGGELARLIEDTIERSLAEPDRGSR